MNELTDDELLVELGVSIEAPKKRALSQEEERVIAGFEDIVRFVDGNGRLPTRGENKNIFERLYAVRLDQLRAKSSYGTLLANLDKHGLLTGPTTVQKTDDELDDAALLNELGVRHEGVADISELKHVRPRAEIRVAEEIAERTLCKDFDVFKPLFVQLRKDLDAGIRETRSFEKDASISRGDFFILGGQVVFVAGIGEEFVNQYDRRDRRLRVIYDNGTESDILLRSLQRGLNKDEAGRRITDASAGPLFGSAPAAEDIGSGTIYVLRSNSNHPEIAKNRDLIHKIGVTGGDVDLRIANAEADPTFLFAKAEVVASYKLFNIHRSKLENLLHRVFAAARLDLQIEDRFGRPVRPREWFLVPLAVIDEVVERIRDQTITEYVYDPRKASLRRSHEAAR